MKSLFILVSLVSSVLFAESLVTKEFTEIEPAILKFVATIKGKQKNIVVAFDYDDTLLSPVSVVGGEGWFSWQEELLKNKTTPSKDLLAENFSDLLTLQSRLLGLVRFKPTEPAIPGVLKALSDKGYSVVVCTSRGFSEYTPTVRELKVNGIELQDSTFAKANHSFSPYLPYDLKNLKKIAMTDKEAKEMNLKEPQQVAFINGIYLTEGQNKGVMLRSLLAKSKQKVHGLVFVDNRKKHIERVEKALTPLKKDVALFTVHYNRVDIDTQPFQQQTERVEQARNEFEQLRNFIN